MNGITVDKVFKEYLIDNQDRYNCWDYVHNYVVNELVNVYNWNIGDTPNKETLRLVYFKEIQKDLQWIQENGVPISKNRTGIKISTDKIEINNYIKSEEKRAMSILKKLKVVKRGLKTIEPNYFPKGV